MAKQYSTKPHSSIRLHNWNSWRPTLWLTACRNWPKPLQHYHPQIEFITDFAHVTNWWLRKIWQALCPNFRERERVKVQAIYQLLCILHEGKVTHLLPSRNKEMEIPFLLDFEMSFRKLFFRLENQKKKKKKNCFRARNWGKTLSKQAL